MPIFSLFDDAVVPAQPVGAGVGVAALHQPGAAVALPLLREGESRGRSFLLAQATGLVEPVSALLGALLAGTVSGYFIRFGPFISFALLGYIGVKMILDAAKSADDDAPVQTLTHPRLLALAVATSIDALAVGVSFALSPPSPGIWLSCAMIGCTTFVLTLLAAALGRRFSLHPRKAGILGGAVLLFIGIKLLLEGIL